MKPIETIVKRVKKYTYKGKDVFRGRIELPREWIDKKVRVKEVNV